MSETSASARLATALRDERLCDLSGLDDDQVDQLLALIAAEKRARADALTAAIEDGLGMVPRPLRSVVKKLVSLR